MQDRRLDVSTNGHRDDDATMRAVFEALDGGRTGPAGAAPAPDGSQPRPAPHLRVVAPEPDIAPAEAGTSEAVGAPLPKRPRAKGADRPRRPATIPAPAGAPSSTPAGAPAADAPPGAPVEAAAQAEAVRAIIGEEPAVGDTPARPVPARLRAEWARWRPLRPFLVATLAPVPFLLLAGAAGGIFSLLALLWMTGVLYAIDEVLKRRGVEGPEPLHSEMADRLSLLLAGLHFALLLFAVWVLSGATGLGPVSWIATFLAFGLWFGQVSNSNAHELIHRTDSRLFRTGMWVYISLLFGHHTSAHRLVHHRFVATADDPSTAADGEGFWSFAARAWPGALIAGYEMEQHRCEKRKAGGVRGMNPYTVYAAGATAFIALMLTLFGFDGLVAYLLLCGHAQLQLLLSDYVQHYGLERRKLPSGALEPAGLQHSWDAPHAFSGLLMLNAPRHADHHAHPGRPWPELRLSPQGRAPLLPYSLPVMATIALVPPVWHRVMDRRVARLRKAA
jgi:alkane 1-monooxygenase